MDASHHPVFKLANAVEVANGGTADNENEMAMEVAGLLGMPVTGGSDAHSVHGIGKFVTAFRDEINNEAEFPGGPPRKRILPSHRTPHREPQALRPRCTGSSRAGVTSTTKGIPGRSNRAAHNANRWRQ